MIGRVGKPIYGKDDFVKFRYNGKILEGAIVIVDSYGTMEQWNKSKNHPMISK